MEEKKKKKKNPNRVTSNYLCLEDECKRKKKSKAAAAKLKENKDNWLTVTYESDFYSSALYPPDSDNRSFSFLLNSDSVT